MASNNGPDGRFRFLDLTKWTKFDKISAAGGLDASLIAGDIKVALLTTVFGLIVAIILQIFYNYIIAKVDSIVNDMEDASITLVDLLVDHKK